MEYKDAIHEGDGMRVLRCWKYLLPLFKANNHKNYAIEAANLLTQYHYIFPPRQAQQLLWSRFINATGKAGHNIPCDLHMEHLNRLCKSAIKMLGVNKTEKSIQRVGKCLRILKVVGERYDREMDISDTTGTHIKPSDTCDRDKILKELTERSNISYLGLIDNMLHSNLFRKLYILHSKKMSFMTGYHSTFFILSPYLC